MNLISMNFRNRNMDGFCFLTLRLVSSSGNIINSTYTTTILKRSVCLNTKTQMTCILIYGDIVVKDLSGPSRDLLTIKVPEKLEDDADIPILRCGPGGDLIVAYRHFASGRKIHAYNKVGALLYEITLDDPMYKLLSPGLPGYISVDLKGRYKYLGYYRNDV